MINHTLFSTPVITATVELSEDQASQLAAAVQTLTAQVGDVNVPSYLNDVVPFHEAITETVLRGFKSLSQRNNWTIVSTKLNRLKSGEAQRIHVHRDVDAFAVLYLTTVTNGSGALTVYDPRFIDHETIDPRTSTFSLEPTLGTLVIAPSYLWHDVQPYHGSHDRLSVVYNGLAARNT